MLTRSTRSLFYDWFESGTTDTDSIDVLMVPSILYLRGKAL